MKIEFKPEDFQTMFPDMEWVSLEACAIVANARLAEMLKGLPTVYFGPEAEEEWSWIEETEITNPGWLKDATRKAKLVEIEEIVQKSHD